MRYVTAFEPELGGVDRSMPLQRFTLFRLWKPFVRLPLVHFSGGMCLRPMGEPRRDQRCREVAVAIFTITSGSGSIWKKGTCADALQVHTWAPCSKAQKGFLRFWLSLSQAPVSRTNSLVNPQTRRAQPGPPHLEFPSISILT